jgi:DNA-binding transcriptional regulator of glucitol operon
VLVVAGCLVFLGLARWQWDRAQSVTGDWQNLGYALQWPLFAGFLVAAWLRFLWLEQHRGPTVRPAVRTAPDPPRAAPATPAEIPASRGFAPRLTPEDDPDDELAAYNAYLARLAAEDRRR